MVYTDILNIGKAAEDSVRQQAGGTHGRTKWRRA